ncbi:MAG: dethiobiotin synthase [Acidithiobacillus sp.]
MRGYFITGTDTGVGKTVVTATLAEALAQRGWRVAALKPVVSGRDVQGRFEDVERLRRHSHPPLSAAECNCYAFDEPIAPHWAAQLHGQVIQRARLTAFVQQAACRVDRVLVEGAGGLLVPLGDDWDYRDWAAELGLPLVLVVALRLGAINHARLTEEAIRVRALPYAGWIGTQPEPGTPAAGTLEGLRACLHGPLLGLLPYVERPNPKALAPVLNLPLNEDNC